MLFLETFENAQVLSQHFILFFISRPLILSIVILKVALLHWRMQLILVNAIWVCKRFEETHKTKWIDYPFSSYISSFWFIFIYFFLFLPSHFCSSFHRLYSILFAYFCIFKKKLYILFYFILYGSVYFFLLQILYINSLTFAYMMFHFITFSTHTLTMAT